MHRAGVHGGYSKQNRGKLCGAAGACARFSSYLGLELGLRERGRKGLSEREKEKVSRRMC